MISGRKASCALWAVLVAFLSLSAAVHVSVKNGSSGNFCVILDSDISGTVYYLNKANQSVAYNFLVNGTEINASGNCYKYDPKLNATVDSLNIYFLPNDITPLLPPVQDRWTISLAFEALEGGEKGAFKIADYKLKTVFYPAYFNRTFPSATYGMSESGANLEWSAKETHGFTCSNSPLTLTNDTKLTFANLKVLALAILPTDQFPKEQLFEQCKLDVRTSDLVPIIVGACLAGLVIIVLVAYLIGRARAKRQGYASV